jgi:hypothetical protein
MFCGKFTYEMFSFTRDAGIFPESWFLDRLNTVKEFGNDPYDSGIGPVSWFPSNDIPPKLGRDERVSGRGPVSLLLVKSMVKRVLICERVLVSLEMEGGIGPTRLGVR